MVTTASLHYVDEYLDSYGKSAFYDYYYDSQTFLDIKCTYRFTPKVNIFFEVNNITNQPLRYYQGKKELVKQLEYYGRNFNLGIMYNL